MTTNELKCPERDTELLKIINNVYQAPEVKLELIIDIIDKAKAAAVIAERERIIKWLDGQMLTDVSGLYNRGYDEALIDIKIYLEGR